MTEWPLLQGTTQSGKSGAGEIGRWLRRASCSLADPSMHHGEVELETYKASRQSKQPTRPKGRLMKILCRQLWGTGQSDVAATSVMGRKRTAGLGGKRTLADPGLQHCHCEVKEEEDHADDRDDPARKGRSHRVADSAVGIPFNHGLIGRLRFHVLITVSL